MGTTLAFRFPLGRYHANPWDRAVNEGASEWPPSQWRILRALVATWHTRWPDLPESVMDGLLNALADPPSYRTPSVRAGHTRHYLPDLDHRKGESGNTDLTLDPFLAVDRDAELLVRWDVDLAPEHREALGKLVELLPYLGRSESACEARLADEDLLPDPSWWRPEADDGTRRSRLLTVSRPLSRSVLEVATTELRRQRRTLPPGTRWVSYAAVEQTPRTNLAATRRSAPSVITAVRFAVTGPAPLMATHGVLLADEAHRQAGLLLEKAGVPDSRRQQIMGTGGAASDHRHAHWIPVSDVAAAETAGFVQSLIIWVPNGLRTEEVRTVLGLRSVSGKRGGEDGYEVRGFPKVRLLFQAAGQIEDVAPELRGPSLRWRSLTPYLPVRHRKPGRESAEEFLAADVAAELRYRGLPEAVSVGLAAPLAGRATQFRRYRVNERIRDSRTGTGLVLEFASSVAGPLSLGQLSHFGFGVFQPEP